MSNVVHYPKSIEERLKEAVRLYRNELFLHAVESFKKLADDGCDDAFVYLGSLYESSKSGLQDFENAYFYYMQAVERGGYVSAYLGLIRIHLYGEGYLKDYGKALEYCKRVIEESQHPYAYFFLGHMYLEGMGVEVNVEKAIENFKKAWEGGYVFGLTFIGLIECKRGHYLKGWWHRLRAGWYGFRMVGNSNNWQGAIPPHWALPDYKERYQY